MHLIPVMRHHPKFHAHEPRTACSLNTFPKHCAVLVHPHVGNVVSCCRRCRPCRGEDPSERTEFRQRREKGLFFFLRPCTDRSPLCLDCVCGAKMFQSAFLPLIFIIDNKPSESFCLQSHSVGPPALCVFSRASNHSR